MCLLIWGPTGEQFVAFDTLKQRFLAPPILRLPVYGHYYTIDVDASKSQLGCALLQDQEDGTLMYI